MNYYIWTAGCQMNSADSEALARLLQIRGLLPATTPDRADLIVLNTCSVRQSAEERALGKAGTLKPLKLARPQTIIALGGCMVADSTIDGLRRRLPFVNIFFKPTDFTDLLTLVDQRLEQCNGADPTGPAICQGASLERPDQQTTDVETGKPTRWLTVMTGCNSRCSYCVVPLRRGRERSRPFAALIAEATRLVDEGAREITLLGQIVDRYGRDLPEHPDLADLLRSLDRLPDLLRIRFLTSHPRDFTDRIIESVATLPNVCEHINLPVQAGDDDVLRTMRRGYTADFYRRTIDRIRRAVPGVALATDVIVGFPGETDGQFQRTLDLLAEIRFDVVHVAMYSSRPGTRAGDNFLDDVTVEEKKARLQQVEMLQAQISSEINGALLGQTLEVLVETTDRGKWKGRTRTNKLVFFADEHDWLGQLARVRIDRTGPWSLQGTVGAMD